MKKKHKQLKLIKFLPYRLSLLSNTISTTIAATYQNEFNISMPEWRIIVILSEYPGISADDVCRHTQIEKSVVSRAVGRLLNRKLLNREVDEQDKRRSCLSLSESGLSIYDKVMPIAQLYEKKLLASLTSKEIDKLSQILDKLQDSALSIS